jgi:hypothetical protein
MKKLIKSKKSTEKVIEKVKEIKIDPDKTIPEMTMDELRVVIRAGGEKSQEAAGWLELRKKEAQVNA